MKGWGRVIPLAAFFLLVLLFWRGLSLNPTLLPSVKEGKSLPVFQLPMLEGTGVFSSEKLIGKISLLNVWASWCAACLDEQPFLMSLTEVPLYGMNYKDSPKKAKHWLDTWGNPYQAVFRDNTGDVAIDLGVYGAPETFLIDKHGVIRFRYAGILTQKIWQQDFLPKIAVMEHEA